MSNDPVRDCLQNAFKALLQGNLAERDRQCKRAERIIQAQNEPPPVELIKGPDGIYRPAIKRRS
jgi:hypothetical protein